MREDAAAIGTYNEKAVHRTLKNYFCPEKELQETEINGNICDAYKDGMIYEIQTGSFTHLKDKLKVFLPDHRVTVVYPLAVDRRIIRADPMSSEILSERMSSKHGKRTDILPELYAVREFINDGNLSVMIAFMKCADIRPEKAGKRQERKSGSVTLPTELLFFESYSGPEDIKEISPGMAPGEYRAKDVRAALGIRSGTDSWRALKMLVYTGYLKETGKDGKAVIYTVT